MLYPMLANNNKMATIKYVASKCFTDEDIEKVKNRLDTNKWKEATVYSDRGDNLFIDPNTIDTTGRKAKSQYLLPNQQDGHPFPQITHIISDINNNYWNYDLRYITFADDAPAIFKYELGGKHSWHIDCSPTQATRKLAYSIQLSDSSDYEGGDLEFFDGDEKGNKVPPEIRKKGSIIVFAAFAWHRITPITKGIRYAMVGWIHGPSYR